MNESRKNKISLDDYDYKRDIENRILMSRFSTLDLEVLEEIIYSPLKIPLPTLSKNLDVDEAKIIPILSNFSSVGLLTIEGDEIVIDKEMRKYFESQIVKFDVEFTPGMDFLQSLLKRVPIQVLPLWYSIPRSSNNIFDSLVEKYLLTPQIFQRYLSELHLGDPILMEMFKAIYSATDFKVLASDLMEQFHLSQEQFEENILLLEFNFVGCLGYEKIGDHWKEIVTPFQEWKEYLQFLRSTEASSIISEEMITPSFSSDFSYIEKLTTLLSWIKEHSPFCDSTGYLESKEIVEILMECPELNEEEIPHLVDKIKLLKLADMIDHRFHLLEVANEWLNMSIENRALFIFRHPLNRLCNVRETEKSISRVLDKGWVYFEDFIKGVSIPLSDSSVVLLKKLGKVWKYTIPEYTEEEKVLIKRTIFEWLANVGITATGKHLGKDCFCVTSFGKSIFDAS